jgi:hypothetical protein
MTSDDETEIERLRRRIFWTQVCVAGVIGIYILSALTPVDVVRQEVRVGDTRLSDMGVTVGSSGVYEHGMFVRRPESFQQAMMETHGLYTAVGVRDENHSLIASLRYDSAIVRLAATGQVDSELQIDTDTGAWRIVRWIEREPGVKTEERVELLGAMPTRTSVDVTQPSQEGGR